MQRTAFSTGLIHVGNTTPSPNFILEYVEDPVTRTNSRLDFSVDRKTTMTITGTERVGISTATPTQKLDVEGNVRIAGALVDSNNTVGTSDQVLTSNGIVSYWSTPSNKFSAGIIESKANITANYTVSVGYNAMSAGPITIDNGVVVTIPDGSAWTIV